MDKPLGWFADSWHSSYMGPRPEENSCGKTQNRKEIRFAVSNKIIYVSCCNLTPENNIKNFQENFGGMEVVKRGRAVIMERAGTAKKMIKYTMGLILPGL